MRYLWPVNDRPCHEKIKLEIAASQMKNKDFSCIEYSEIVGAQGYPELTMTFPVELDQVDRAILDAIVVDSIGKVKVECDCDTLMGRMISACSDKDQRDRLYEAMNTKPAFIFALKAGDFVAAREQFAAAVSVGGITQDDHDALVTELPDPSAIWEAAPK